MLRIYTNLLLLMGMSLLFTGCFTPQKVIRIAPEAQENVFWFQGQPIAEKKQDSVIVRAAFSHTDRKYLLFDIEVINEKDFPILVSPEVLSLKTTNGYQMSALDPEDVILSMEMRASQKEANAKNAAVAGGIVLVGAAVVAATSDNDSGSDNYYDNDALDALEFAVDVAVPTIAWGLSFHQDPILTEYPEALPSSEQLLFWQEIVLRRTTLRPGESIRGLVAFPRFDNTQSLKLTIPLENDSFEFLFTQKLYQP
ncbi:MAG: hypothetical protein ACRBG0_17680 [Lewinella sp.]|uniref:hypothetical protein n=1 Tax=Lewinella sp. TaxID=2004506 RepID=UPI003D6BB8F3